MLGATPHFRWRRDHLKYPSGSLESRTLALSLQPKPVSPMKTDEDEDGGFKGFLAFMMKFARGD